MKTKGVTRRREFLKALGLGASAGLAGCLDISNQQTVTDVAVRRLPNQYSIQPNEAIVPDSVGGNNVFRGQQVRVNRRLVSEDGETQPPEMIRSALFTVLEDPPIPPSGDIYISDTAMDALPLEEGDILTVDTNAPSTNLQNVSEARESQELIEQFIDDRNNRRRNNNSDLEGFLVTAPYGGTMAQNTGKQARRVTETDVKVRAWALFGFDATDDGYDRWRIPASELDVLSYPKLFDWRVRRERRYRNRRRNQDRVRRRNRVNLTRRTEYVVSFEDYPDEDINGVLIRGLADRGIQEMFRRNIQQQLNQAAAGASVRVTDAGGRRGLSPQHFANRFSQSGRDSIVISQETRIHETYWREVADGVLQTLEAISEQDSSG